jgi:16S rRNA processing protein RimM
MQHAENLKLLGVFLKTHGKDGNLILKIFYFKDDEIGTGEPVFVEIDGIPVPFFVSEFRFLSDYTAVMKLEEVDDPLMASEFVNCRIFQVNQGTKGIDEEKSKEYDRLKGFRVFDIKYGDTGILQEIVEFSGNTVMRIDHRGKEVLVPFHDNIIKDIDYKSSIVKISAPEGLLDLYL